MQFLMQVDILALKIIDRKHSSNKETHDLGDALELRAFGGLLDLGE